ncbi:Hypothetical protein PENO1_013260 [Penicillium occitanis (nom. inval.)]|nr:Hypothetical protein PENO1_013260 [Penicillium occitanis (nom. inval.)]PCH10190.1 hypothetical protein PENOC_003070 [Penicillium occitanis (nom. inval.)]
MYKMTASKIDKKHVIDPDGEVKFLLENANAPFAVWDKEEEEEKISKPTPRKSAKQPPKKKAKLDDDGASKDTGIYQHTGFCKTFNVGFTSLEEDSFWWMEGERIVC